jgi:hypothetical protein
MAANQQMDGHEREFSSLARRAGAARSSRRVQVGNLKISEEKNKMKKQSKPSRIWSDSKRSHSPWEQQTRTDAALKAAQKRSRRNGK